MDMLKFYYISTGIYFPLMYTSIPFEARLPSHVATHPACTMQTCSLTHESQRLHSNCGTASPPSLYLYAATARPKKAPLVWLRNVTTASWSGTSFCPHRLACGASGLEANWRREQLRYRKAWKLSLDRESSATHDGEKTGEHFKPARTGSSRLRCLHPWRNVVNFISNAG